MPRKTRAAAKAQEAVLADVDVDETPQDLPASPQKGDREPLRSITPNSIDSIDNERPAVEEMTKAKGKKGKKGGAKKKGKKAAKADTIDEPENVEVVAGKTNDAGDDALEANGHVEPETADVEDPIAAVEEPKAEERPQSSLGRSTRLTRRQLAQLEAEAEAAAEPVVDPAPTVEAGPLVEEAPVEPEGVADAQEETQQTSEEITEDTLSVAAEAPEPKAIAGELILSPPETITPEEVLLSPVPAPSERSINTTALSPVLQELPDRTRPEPLSLVASNTSSRRASQLEEGIDALDALEDEIDEVAKIIPSLDSPLSPVKPRTVKSTQKPKQSVQIAAITKPAPTRTTKLAGTTQPSTTLRIKSLAEPKKPVAGLARSTSTKTRPKSIIVDTKGKDKPVAESSKDGKPVDYLAAKRRPVSVSFPTPPPAAKSSKPVTTANFTLPGEAVAAKLKAQRLERQKREEEEAAKRREFKARPVPTIRPKPVEVKQTAASRARQSIVGDGEKENAGGLKRSSTVTGATSTAAKRSSIIAAKRSSVIGAPKPSATATNTANTAQKRSSIIAPKPRVAPASTSLKDRAPSNSSDPISRSVSGSDAAALRMKGKEVYNRDRVEKEAREKAQKEKDDAIKRARAEAAERGRQASRDWAEKQKKLAMEKKKAASPTEAGALPSVEAAVAV